MDDLNKKYFETREKHKGSYNKRGYIIWIIIGLSVASFLVGREIIRAKRVRELIELTTKELTEQGKITERDTTVTVKSAGMKILVLKDCLFKEVETSLISIKIDSSGLTCMARRIISDPDYSSSINQWENQIKQTEPSYKFINLKRDSIEDKIIESADIEVLSKDKRLMKGLIRIIKIGGLNHVIHVVTYEDYWDDSSANVKRIFDSVEILE